MSLRHSLNVQAPRLWQGLLVLLLCAILYLALSPTPAPSADLGWDKLNHAFAFWVLTGVARRAFTWHAATTALMLLGYGALIEVLQSFTPNRSAEWADLLADALGIALGIALGWALTRVPHLHR